MIAHSLDENKISGPENFGFSPSLQKILNHDEMSLPKLSQNQETKEPIILIMMKEFFDEQEKKLEDLTFISMRMIQGISNQLRGPINIVNNLVELLGDKLE